MLALQALPSIAWRERRRFIMRRREGFATAAALRHAVLPSSLLDTRRVQCRRAFTLLQPYAYSSGISIFTPSVRCWVLDHYRALMLVTLGAGSGPVARHWAAATCHPARRLLAAASSARSLQRDTGR